MSTDQIHNEFGSAEADGLTGEAVHVRAIEILTAAGKANAYSEDDYVIAVEKARAEGPSTVRAVDVEEEEGEEESSVLAARLTRDEAIWNIATGRVGPNPTQAELDAALLTAEREVDRQMAGARR
jgi:hypothetical protein